MAGILETRIVLGLLAGYNSIFVNTTINLSLLRKIE
jgi:hypothetical protein